jgi:hypothetical protein
MGSAWFRPGPVELRVGDPIPTEGMKVQDRARFTRLLEEKVAELCGERAPARQTP